jgi:hypothetical protein
VAREALIIDEEVANGGGTFKPLPAGWYHVEIEDVEERQVKNGKNTGKEMFGYKFKVVGGDYDNRKLFAQSCLWQEAIFTQRDIQKAVGIVPPEAKNGKVAFRIADEDELIGKELKVRIIVKPKHVKAGEEPETDADGNLVEDNEVKAFAPLKGETPAAKKSGAKKAGGFDL